MTTELPQFTGLSEFYPYYLGEHRNGVCRSLHLLATTSVRCLALGEICTTSGLCLPPLNPFCGIVDNLPPYTIWQSLGRQR